MREDSSTYLDVKEAGPGDVGHRRANLLAGVDDVDPEGVHSISADVIAIYSRDEHLALVVVDEQAADHLVRSLIGGPVWAN